MLSPSCRQSWQYATSWPQRSLKVPEPVRPSLVDPCIAPIDDGESQKHTSHCDHNDWNGIYRASRIRTIYDLFAVQNKKVIAFGEETLDDERCAWTSKGDIYKVDAAGSQVGNLKEGMVSDEIDAWAGCRHVE